MKVPETIVLFPDDSYISFEERPPREGERGWVCDPFRENVPFQEDQLLAHLREGKLGWPAESNHGHGLWSGARTLRPFVKTIGRR